MSRIFEAHQQPAIQTKIVPCPQNRSTLEDGKRYPNLKREAPAVFMKLNMNEITACGYTNRVPKKQEIGGIFV